jgi:UDP-N-acetylmuramoyl-tripeptide--D-alanyl-D-alanine ligase
MMTAHMNLLAAAQAMGGALAGGGSTENLTENVTFVGVSTDSRNIAPGQLFIALRGDNFDGHAFVATAQTRGAVAAVVADHAVDAALRALGLPLVLVADTRLALGALAANWRARFDLPLIGVSGSNGKTTSKEMIASIMRAAFGDTVLVTQGNFNNDIGLPLTLLGMNATHRAAVIELGMNQPGEIAYLAGICRPSVALVTNAQRAHLAGMGSLAAIAREKGSLYAGLSESGIAVINADDPWADLWRSQSKASGVRKVMSFSLEQASADVYGQCHMHGLETRLTLYAQGEVHEIVLALPGRHNAKNALAAAAAALAAGVSLRAVCDGLSAFKGVKGRLQQRVGINGSVLLDDTYNANPDSVRAGIDVLAATVGRKILVLGDMGEIGEMTGQFHDEVGGYAKSQGIDRLLAFGGASQLATHNFGAGAQHYTKIEDLIAALRAELNTGLNANTTVLIKGSRFMRMERVVDAIGAIGANDAGEQK